MTDTLPTGDSIRGVVATYRGLAKSLASGNHQQSDGTQGSITVPGGALDWLAITLPDGGIAAPLTVPGGFGFIENVNDTGVITYDGNTAVSQFFAYQGDQGGQTFIYNAALSGDVAVVAMTGFGNTFITPQTGAESGTFDVAMGLADATQSSFTLATPTGTEGNTVVAGSGTISIAAGLGTNFLVLGSGADAVASEGNDIVVVGTGTAVVNAQANANSPTVFGGAGDLTFYGGSSLDVVVGQTAAGGGSILAFGGSGSLQAYGGTGTNIFIGGSGNNLLVAGTGASTLYGGTGSDVLVSNGAAAVSSVLVAGSGNETLFGADFGGQAMYAGSGSDVIVGGTGAEFMQAGHDGTGTFYLQGGNNIVAFLSGSAGGSDAVVGFDVASDHLALFGYADGSVANVLASETVSGGNTSLVLPDGTQVELVGVTGLGAGNFYTG